MRRVVTGLIASFLMLAHGTSTLAVTLEEYGVEIASSGLVDMTNGLRWLDADLTLGTSATVNGLLENGWRIATGNELHYLLTRNTFNNDNPPDPGEPDNPLTFSDFLSITNALGMSTNGLDDAFDQPWGCLWIYGDSVLCQTTTNWAFTQYAIAAESAFPGLGTPGVDVDIFHYITEVPLYGNFEIGVCDTCTGRALLVRNVPLPAGIWLLMSALVALHFTRKVS